MIPGIHDSPTSEGADDARYANLALAPLRGPHATDLLPTQIPDSGDCSSIRLRPRLGKQREGQDEARDGSAREEQKRGHTTEGVGDIAGQGSAQRCADTNSGTHHALGDVEMATPAHDVRNDERDQDAERRCWNAIEQLRRNNNYGVARRRECEAADRERNET